MFTRSFWRWSLVAALGLGAAGVWRAGANNAMLAPSGPPTIALVNLERVMNNLDELNARNTELQAFVDERRALLESLQKQLEQAKTNLDILPKNSADHKKKFEEAIVLQSTLELQQKISVQLIDMKKGEMSRDLFEKIRDAVGRMAKQRGFNIVLSNDSEIAVEPGDQLQVTRQIAARKVMYADASLDVSEDVLQMMNNEWKAGGGKPPGASAPGAPGGKPGGF